MQLVDLTGTWRDGEFYKVKAIHQCIGCAFYKDGAMYGKQCYDALCCEGADKNWTDAIYIHTDDDSVATYIQRRMDYVPERK